METLTLDLLCCSLETDKCIYLVTEPVVPLAVHLKECDEASALATSWGLHQTLVSQHAKKA